MGTTFTIALYTVCLRLDLADRLACRALRRPSPVGAAVDLSAHGAMVCLPLLVLCRHELRWLAAVLIAPFLISTEKLSMLVHELVMQSANRPGDDIPLAWPYRWFTALFYQDTHSVVRDALLSLPLIVICLVAWRRSCRPTLVVLGFGSVALYLGMAWLNLHGGGVLGGYKAFKVLSFFWPVTLAALLAPFTATRAVRSGCHADPAAILLCRLQPQRGPLRGPQHGGTGKGSLRVGQRACQQQFRRHVEAYFLADKNVFIRAHTYFFPSPQLSGEWNLVESQDVAPATVLGFPPAVRQPINNRFSLTREGGPIVLHRTAVEHAPHSGHRQPGRDGRAGGSDRACT